MKRGIITILAIAASVVLAFCVPIVKHTVGALPVVHAQDQNSGCSNASLKGAYAIREKRNA